MSPPPPVSLPRTHLPRLAAAALVGLACLPALRTGEVADLPWPARSLAPRLEAPDDLQPAGLAWLPALPALVVPDLPSPAQSLGQALDARPDLRPAGRLPLADGLTLHLAVPLDDDCSPQAGWLLCPGLRMVAEGEAPGAPLRAVWLTQLLPEAAPLAPLRQAALASHGPPVAEGREMERRRGLDMPQHRMLWRQHRQGLPLWLEAVFVLEDAPADPDAPGVLRIGWSVTPDDGAAAAPAGAP
ncbi:hypothetical protein [Falsiroseomonas sp.]|uniref:hypothetical protein n=1 Tax=Falsiroseomonas sp. TaxID=2870721 RepID=UPI003F70431E